RFLLARAPLPLVLCPAVLICERPSGKAQNMADRWYYGWDDQKLGPFTALELRALADQGKIQAMDTVWKEGVPAGIFAHQVKNLFAPPPAEGFAEAQSAGAATVPAPPETLAPARCTAE